ncbi:hypothetical protein Tco_1532564 [Tanacetum coccineum]
MDPVVVMSGQMWQQSIGDSIEVVGTEKHFQVSGGSGCTDDVEFSGWEFKGEWWQRWRVVSLVTGHYLLHAELAMSYVAAVAVETFRSLISFKTVKDSSNGDLEF